MKKLISWNVNGLRACVTKGFENFFKDVDADIFCLQETKLQEGQIDLLLEGYHQYWCYADKKGYSGTAMFTKEEPLNVCYGIGIDEHDHEGRVITAEFDNCFVVTCYTPNSQSELKRLDYRMKWEDDFKAYLKKLEEKKPVIMCGDLNVAHKEIDLKNPKTNRKNAGFTALPDSKSSRPSAAAIVSGHHPPKRGSNRQRAPPAQARQQSSAGAARHTNKRRKPPPRRRSDWKIGHNLPLCTT